MNTQKKIETYYGMPIKDIIDKLHWEKQISINRLSKDANIIRQSLMHALKVLGIKVRTVKQATQITKNKGEKHWAFGQTKETHPAIMSHSERMLQNNPVHCEEHLKKAAKTRSAHFKKNMLPQEIQFEKILNIYKIKHEVQYPLYVYIIDFYIPHKRLCIEVDTTSKWGKERRNKALIKDKYLIDKNYKIIRINKNHLDRTDFIFNILKSHDLVVDT